MSALDRPIFSRFILLIYRPSVNVFVSIRPLVQVEDVLAYFASIGVLLFIGAFALLIILFCCLQYLVVIIDVIYWGRMQGLAQDHNRRLQECRRNQLG